MDVHTPEQRSRNMRAIRGKDTKAELILRKALWAKGYRYYKNYKKLPGTPDIVFTRVKVAIFVDGEFWHGYKWEKNKNKIGTNKEFWINKIEDNMIRDRKVEKELKKQGWKVIRFWSREVIKNIDRCVGKIESELQKRHT